MKQKYQVIEAVTDDEGVLHQEGDVIELDNTVGTRITALLQSGYVKEYVAPVDVPVEDKPESEVKVETEPEEVKAE